MDHLAFHRILDENFGPLNPVAIEIKEALKLPEDLQEILEAMWDGRLDWWWFIPIYTLTRILDEQPNLSLRETQIRFHALSYVLMARLLEHDTESDFDFIFQASAYAPLLSSPFRDTVLFWDCPWH